jgi:2-methylisocitrate lyase-like PEP mutase family enzyme
MGFVHGRFVPTAVYIRQREDFISEWSGPIRSPKDLSVRLEDGAPLPAQSVVITDYDAGEDLIEVPTAGIDASVYAELFPRDLALYDGRDWNAADQHSGLTSLATGGPPMSSQLAKAEAFRALHERPGAFVIPNPWDAGSAVILASMGFAALATTSAGLAFSLGLRDGGGLTRQAAIANVKAIAEATPLPVSADLENCYADAPAEAAQTLLLAAEAGAVGGSIEDASGDPASPIYDFALAVERIEAAAEAVRKLHFPFTLTARAENFLHGRRDLDDTIRRLQAFERAGADVLYAPALPSLEAIRTVCQAVTKPVNVLAAAGQTHSVAELAVAGAKRVSVGALLNRVALGAFMRAARELKDAGTVGFSRDAATFAEIQALMRKPTGD